MADRGNVQLDEFEFYRRQAFGGAEVGARSDRDGAEGSFGAVGRSMSVRVRTRTRLTVARDDEHSEEEERRLRSAYRSSPRHASLAAPSRFEARRASDSRGRQDALSPAPDLVPVRSFATTSHGIVNKGDSLKSSTSSVDETSNANANAEMDLRVPVAIGSRRGSFRPCPSPADNEPLQPQGHTGKNNEVHGDSKQLDIYYVQILGAAGVGKSSLCQQFLTSEYMGDMDPDELHPQSRDNAIVLMRLSVKLDGEEAILVLLDSLPHVEDQDMEVLAEMDAYVVVYGVDDRPSFGFAHTLLIELLEKRNLKTAVLLVGNKSDLVRTREIDGESGKMMSKKFNCRFVETSSTLNHGVDELLVNILKDIRTRAAHADKQSKSKEGDSTISRLFKRMSVRVKKPMHRVKTDS